MHIARLMVLGHLLCLAGVALAVELTYAGHSPTVSDVDDVNVFVHRHDHDCTAASFVHRKTILHGDGAYKVVFGLLAAFIDGRAHVLRKHRVHDDVVVERVFEVLRALVSSMPVENSKNLNFRPICNLVCLFLGLDHIQDNCDSVFVALPHRAHIRVRSEGTHAAKGFGAGLRVLEVR